MNKPHDARAKLIALLAAHRQRATYAAVGGAIGLPALSTMKGLPRTPVHSWVVATTTGLPTGYTTAEMDPLLQSNGKVIRTTADLVAWLQAHGWGDAR